MDLKEAMEQRHMVRKYTDKIISDDLIEKISNRIKENNEKLSKFENKPINYQLIN